MRDGLISVIDLANKLERRKQFLFKVIARLGLETQLLPGSNSRGQLVAHLTDEDASLLENEIRASSQVSSPRAQALVDQTFDAQLTEQGVFYFLALEPLHDPLRFKLGFAASLPERLRQLKCSAPLLQVLRTWPCKRLWEKTAIDCVAAGCERVHTEVFRADEVSAALARADAFFAAMPEIR